MARIFSLMSAGLVLLALNTVAAFWKCDFETDMCGWKDSVGVNSTWLVTNSTTIDPGHDHTCMVPNFIPLINRPASKQQSLGDSASFTFIPRPYFPFHRKCGNWLTTLPVNKFKGKQDFVLYSKQLDATTGDGCMTFYYHFFGLSKASISLMINSKAASFDASNIWAKYIPQGNRWAKAQVHIPKQASPFYLIFKASLDAKYHDVVGLDDITLSDYPCQASGGTDFESGNQAWDIDGASIATGGEPINDHTTNSPAGHMALSGTKHPSTLTSSIANLTRQFSSGEYSNCLKFYYQFIGSKNDGDTESYLEVNTTEYNYFNRRITARSVFSDGLDNSWQLMAVNIPSNRRAGKTNLTIGMSTQGSTKIAIDDITVADKVCQSIGDCDFESDMCGWTQSTYTDGLWLRSDGANSKSFKESPKMDHTTHTENGWFAIIPNEFLGTSAYATLRSPPLTPSLGTCFEMFYFARTKSTNQTVLSVTVRDLIQSGKLIATYPVKATTGLAYWTNFTIRFPKKMPRKYSIEITTKYTVGEMMSDIAIDDLKIGYSCASDWNQASTPAPSPVPYAEKKWDCNFDYGYCSNWKFDSNWKMTSFQKLGVLKNSSSPPRVDHTQNSHRGGYLLYLPKDEDGLNATTLIYSSMNSTNITIQPHCLSFFYYDASEVLVNLDVVAVHPSYRSIEKSIRPNSASRTWTRVRVDFAYIYQQTNISISFQGGRGANASFAIDDIELRPGACKHMDNYIYTMDALENIDLNKITPMKGGIGNLVRYGSDQQSMAPKHDHTTGRGGYFLFMNKKTDYNTTYQSELVIDNLPKMDYRKHHKGRCLKFAYQIYGNADLQVYVDTVDSSSHGYPIFRTAANHTNWMMAQASYGAFYDHKITFAMEKPFDVNSYVALDDVSFSDNCDRVVQCDFDDDVCSYNSDYNGFNNYAADYEFARFVAPPISPLWPGPGFDHTKQGYGGGYLYMTGFPSKAKFHRTAEMETPISPQVYTPSVNACISLFSFITKNDAEFDLVIRLFSRDKNTKRVNLMKLTNITETKWTRHYVDIDYKLFDGYSEYVFVLQGSTRDPNTVIAIDDIDYSTSPCSFRHQFKCKNGNTIDNDQVCNFRDDCKDNSDEVDCGSCDFETDLCGWQNGTDMFQSKTGGMWIQTAAGAPKSPSTDGKMSKKGHFLMLQKSKYSDPNYQFVSDSVLTRGYHDYQHQFKDAYFTCYMTFDAFVGSSLNHSLAYLEVYAGSDVDSAVLKERTNFDGTNEWSLNAAFIGGYPHSFVVFFKARELVGNETIAVDNIEFNNCSFPAPVKDGMDCPDDRAVMCNTTRVCIDPSDLCDFENNCGDNWDESYELCAPFNTPDVPVSCAFEKSLDTCGMTADFTPKTYFRWQLDHGSEGNFKQYHAPTADHTTKDKNGQFARVSTYGVHLGKTAYLYSPMMSAKESDPCVVRFFYYVNGDFDADNNNVFSVYAQYADGSLGESKTLFTSSNYLATWNKAHAELNSKQPFRFVFTGQLFDKKGSISLDDISYTDTCFLSSAEYRPGKAKHGASALLIIFLIILALGLVGGGYFAYRKHQAGELSCDWISGIRSLIPGGSTAPTAFENPSFSK